jgi:hypothetical protein
MRSSTSATGSAQASPSASANRRAASAPVPGAPIQMEREPDHHGHHPALADQVAERADVGGQALAVERADRERDRAGRVGYGQADPALAEVESEHGALHGCRS